MSNTGRSRRKVRREPSGTQILSPDTVMCRVAGRWSVPGTPPRKVPSRAPVSGELAACDSLRTKYESPFNVMEANRNSKTFPFAEVCWTRNNISFTGEPLGNTV